MMCVSNNSRQSGWTMISNLYYNLHLRQGYFYIKFRIRIHNRTSVKIIMWILIYRITVEMKPYYDGSLKSYRVF